MSKLINKMESFLSKTHVSIIKTIYVNLRLLPIKEAIKLPIFIYGRCNICGLSGRVKINGVIKRGMIKLGVRQGYFTAPSFGGMLLISDGCEIVFNGPCSFDYNYAIRITEGGLVEIGKGIGFGSDTKIYCENHIKIGSYCRIPYGSTFMDTNYHYSIDTQNGTIYRKDGSIEIGDYNWIGNTSTVMKGTKTPIGAIIASKSHLNKDFIKLGEGKKCLVIAGSPAKIVKECNTRVHSYTIEAELNQWFENNPNASKCEDKSFLQKIKEQQPYMQ